MAPEILRYEKYDAKADLWSVGAVLYEMSVGKPPFRAQNHIELLKRIEAARSTVKFPDEDPNFGTSGSDALVVPDDMKDLIRSLLKRHAVDRVSFKDFFGSQALQNSKFPRPDKNNNGDSVSERVREPWVARPGQGIPDSHRIIPPEVLDPKSIIPPSTFNFRKREREGNASSAGSSNAPGTSEGSRRSSIGVDAEARAT